MANPYRHYASGEPYYDDFDVDKNYVKVLFRPSVAVQARELTQSQTYLNNQLAAFGGYFFKDGTPIDGARISYSSKQPVVRIEKPNTTNPEDYIKRYIVGETFLGLLSNQEIQITDYYIDDSNTNSLKYYLLFSYLGSSIKENEDFKAYTADGTTVTFTTIGGASNSLVAACSEGTIFVDGYFIHVPKSERNLIISILNEDAAGIEYYVGFDITRKEITASEDSSLNDNAIGSYNYKAPGANRYQINAKLAAYEKSKVPSTNTNGEIDFISGIVIKDGVLIKEQSSEIDGNLTDLLARRTYEESGSYTVNPWKVQIKEHETDNSKYIVSVEPGIGYIYGYRVSSLVSQELEVDKPRTYIEKENNVDYIADGIYTYAKFESNNDSEDFTLNALQANQFPDFLRLEDVYVMPVSGENGYTGVTPLGTCKITDLYKQGSYFIIYLTNVNDVLGAFGSAKSLVSKADVDSKSKSPRFVNLMLDSNNCADIFGTDSPKIIPTGYTMVTPSVTDGGSYDNYINGSLEYQFVQTYTTKAVSKNTLSFTITTNNYSAEVDTTGLLYIYSITGNNVGKHIDITNLRVTSSNNTVTIQHQDNTEIFEEGASYIVCARYTIRNGNVRSKIVVQTSETISISTNDTVTLKNEDIIDIVSLTTDGDETDYKDYVTLDNGQTDYLYDYGKVSGLSSVYNNKTAKSFTITYRYYKHSSVAGPFSASSYIDRDGNNAFVLGVKDMYTQIPVYRSKSSGKIYKLRDCLDFRVKISELGNDKGLTYYPNSRTRLSYNLGIYLPRIDAVWVDKKGNFGVTQGIPSQSPEPPEEKDGVMTIYYLYNEAYGENVNVKYINNQRHTMADITELENRITNVENVVSLSMLEQSAVNMQITDEEGLNRYKSGIFTDNFSSYDNSDYTNEEWSASIDAVECSIRPLYECEEHSFSLDSQNSTNVETQDGVVLTLVPSGKEVLVENDTISESTNIQSLMFYVWCGSLTLTPSIDTWVTDLGNIVVSETWVETPKPPTTYRTWSVSSVTDVQTSTQTSTSTQRRDANDGWGSYWTDTYKTNTTTITANVQTKTTTETTSYTGSWVTSNVYTQMESQDTYMREIDVQYSLKGMRPGMKLTATIDSVPLTLSNNVVGSDGTLVGTFKVPEKMTVGIKLVEFYDAEDTSAASAEYTANGKTVWTNVDRTYIRTWTALVSTDTQTSNSTQTIGQISNSTKVSSVYKNLDPIAESFYIDSPNGVMLESIDLYFAKKDEQVNVEVIVVECENGYPSQTMVPFSRVTLSPKDVKILNKSDISSSTNLSDYATNFKFQSPIYLSPNTEYAFIVIAPSYNYEIYTSTLGAANLIKGIGIREQPYIGSMFKSQNLRTWTAEQLSDIAFKIYKYKFANTTGEALFTINVPENDFKSSMQTLALNTFIPNQTNIDYWYKWKDGKYTQFNNKEDIFNKSLMTISSNKNDTTSLLIRCDMSTYDENISPMIDLEQVYGIFTNNIVSKTSENSYISDNLGDGKYVYYCGTYISNPVTLENSGEDLRVILDAILPNSSGIKVSFKTTSYNPLYLEHGTTGYCISDDEVLNNIGNTMQVYYYNDTSDKLLSPYNYDDDDSTIEPPKCIITGYSGNKVFVRSISDQDVFKDVIKESGTSAENAYNGLNAEVTGIYLLPILNETEIPCSKWTSKVYNQGDYVFHDGFIWKANRKTSANNTPSEYSIVWDKIEGIKVISVVKTDDTVVWRPMSTESINVDTTKSSSSLSTEENFKEYTYYPELEVESDFTDFTIRIDLYSMNEVDVPRVKNLRAIALV